MGVKTPATTAPLLGEPLPVELMNTIWADRDGVHEALDTPPATAAWLRAIADRADLTTPGLTGWLDTAAAPALEALHEDLRSLRDAVRRVAARRTDDPRSAAVGPLDAARAIATLNRYAADNPTWPVLEWPLDVDEPHASSASSAEPGSTVVADLARATITLLDAGSDAKLRACQAPGCVLYFVKNHQRREWCSDGCGNRARQARYYRRHHPDVR